jgi:glycosyltransferase involved in cell wall biosynthesis
MTIDSTSTSPRIHAPSSRRSMRILHYSTWKTPCGIAGYTESLVNALTDLGLCNTVRPIDRKRLSQMSNKENIKEMNELCRQARDFDLVHIQHEFSFFKQPLDVFLSNRNFSLALRQLRKQSTPTVVTFHTEPFFSSIPMSMRTRLALMLKGRYPWHGWTFGRAVGRRKNLVRVIVHTGASRAAFTEVGVPPDILEVIPIGVPNARTAHCNLDPSAAKSKLGFPPDCILLSLFGFVAAYKGHEIAAKALCSLPSNYRLAVVGGTHPEGNDTVLNRVLRIRKKLEPGRLVVTGFVSEEELDLYHAATDICLAPYIDDSLSSSAAITWALTSGKPIIASGIRAFREINAEADCMMMVTPKAEEELAWKIEQLVASPSLQARLVANAKRYARNHTWSETAKRILSIYEQLSPVGCGFAPPTGAYPETPNQEAA